MKAFGYLLEKANILRVVTVSSETIFRVLLIHLFFGGHRHWDLFVQSVLWKHWFCETTNLVYFLLLLGTFLLIGCPSRLHLEQSESWAFGLGITCKYSKPFELWTCLIWKSAIVTVWNSPTFMLGNYGATFVTLQSVISSWITAEENLPMADPV